MRASIRLGILFIAIATGCSAVTSTDTDELDPASDGSTDAGTATRDGGSAGMDGTTPPTDSGTPRRDSGTPVRDSGPTPGRDAGPVETDAGPSTPAVPCGEMSCETDTAAGCCFAEGREPYCFGGATGVACTCEGTFCDTTEVTCNGASDCPGEQRCCAFYRFTGDRPQRIDCAPECEGGTITDSVEVCDPSDPMPCASSSDECHSESRLPDGYSLCRPD